jgi:2-iminoacetate synthase
VFVEAGAGSFIDEARIGAVLEGSRAPAPARVREILARARELAGLALEDVAALAACEDPALLDELFHAARWVKEEIYGSRLVLFAPLYFSNLCGNNCVYCAFRASNRDLTRRVLTPAEVAEETRVLVEMGHKRVLLIAGEAYPAELGGFDYVLKCIEACYGVKSGRGEVRRINVNVAPLSVEQFRQLKAAKIGTYQLFQETYHRETYRKVHPGGKKKDYDYRVTVMDRAMEGGIDDVGIGPLFGLYDWKFELLATMQHIAHLEQKFGVGPHTISMPRIEPAVGSDVASHPPHAVSDLDFKKIVAILRLAVPYTGLILSTRETPEMRHQLLALGISQMSAGSRVNPGGYGEAAREEPVASQFEVSDHRSLDEVIRDVASMGYIPSFCTGCYRLGRTGGDFMDLAKPGDIKYHCAPNALSTFQEYLADYATPLTRAAGEDLIAKTLAGMDPQQRAISENLVKQVRAGKRDVYV